MDCSEYETMENTQEEKQAQTLQLIYKRLIDWLNENRRFIEDGLNRKTVAAMLKTNEKYLCKAIQEFSEDHTLAKLVNHMRTRYAAELLVKYEDYTVEAIAEECGFNSRRSFYRTFHRYYQCTPIEFRRGKAEGKKQSRDGANKKKSLQSKK